MKNLLFYYFIIIFNSFFGIFCIYLINYRSYSNFRSFNDITYFDLGSNNGDSILWLFGYKNINNSYHVPYPKFNHFPTSKVTVHSFEANPNLCKYIQENVNFLKSVTYQCNFYINCPVAISNKSGFIKFKITSGTLGSSLYYNKTDNKSNFINVRSIDIIKYINQHLYINSFNILKFDIEGEEYIMIPNLIEQNIMNYFDVVFSEFHPNQFHPLNEKKSNAIYKNFHYYMNKFMIQNFEEYNISNDLMKIYNNKINILFYFRNFLFNYKIKSYNKYFIPL